VPTLQRSARLTLTLAVTASALVLAGCAGQDGAAGDGDARVQVMASFYPLQFVAQGVGGDRVEVGSLTPPGAEPHDLELSPAQVGELGTVDLVVYLSAFQPAVDEAVEATPPDRVIDAATVTELLPTTADDDSADGLDPHFWLDPSRLPALASEVADQLSAIDPEGAETYAANAAALSARFDELDATYTSALEACTSRTFVTSHAAFAYLADRYDLEQVAISGVDPEADPSPARLAEIGRLVADEDVTTIFFETLVSPKVAQTLADDLGVDAAVLDPLEGVTDPSDDYFTVAAENLDALTAALTCS
jgi:zinc transport system substrate-binding protein